MTEPRDAIRDLVQRAHEEDPELIEFDLDAGLADLRSRAPHEFREAQSAAGRNPSGGSVIDDDPDAVPYSERGVQELVARYGDAARAMVMRRGFDQPEAEAVVQEAYILVLKTWRQRGCLVKPHLLLFATVRKKVADEFRRQNRKPVNLVENSEDITETAEILWQTHFAGSLINKLDVAKALLDLPQRQRAVLVLRFMDELEISVVAELLGCTPNDVKYAQRTGLDNMRTSQWLAGHTGSAEVHR